MGEGECRKSRSGFQYHARNKERGDTLQKAHLVLSASQIIFLDQVALDARAETGRAVRRSDVLRAILDDAAQNPDAIVQHFSNDKRETG